MEIQINQTTLDQITEQLAKDAPDNISKISRESIEQFSQTEGIPNLRVIVNSKCDYSFSVNL
ncbi:MAG: hypothetical protein U9R34_04805 [Nanoarchaeota archaeon]|nr:hypothetical protein [Nanoarchaeota archaeon]